MKNKIGSQIGTTKMLLSSIVNWITLVTYKRLGLKTEMGGRKDDWKKESNKHF